MLPFGRLWYDGPQAVANAIGYADQYSRSQVTVIRVYDEAGYVIETHEHTGKFKEQKRSYSRHVTNSKRSLVSISSVALGHCVRHSPETGWPQRSQLQPGVPSLGRCVTLLAATFCKLGLGDPLSSCNKEIGSISYSFLFRKPTAATI